MKKNATPNRTKNTGKLFFRKTLILSLMMALLPGCTNLSPKGDIETIGYCLDNVVTHLFINYDRVNDMVPEVDYLADAGPKTAPILEINNKGGKVPADNTVTTVPATDNQIPLNQAIPFLLIDTDHHFDPHDNTEEENVITANLPKLLRVVIMALLIVFIL